MWVGDAPDEAALEAVLAPEVTCDLEPLGSAFSRAASAPALADAVREVKLTEATVQTGELLAGLSFSRALASALPTTLAVPCRAVVIFYRAKAGPTDQVHLGGVRLRHIGDGPTG